MAAPIDIIQLEAHDDVISVRDRLAFTESYRVLLVWPETNGAVLSRKLDLVLLQREVRRRKARIALVTEDIDVIDNAGDLNISTYYSVEQAQENRWKRGRANVFVGRGDRPEDAKAEIIQAAGKRRDIAPTTSQRMFRRIGRILVLIVLVAILFGAAYVFLPSATVTITPMAEHLDVTMRIIADPLLTNADLESLMIPATTLTIEIEEQVSFETTGSRDESPTLARGTVVFTNQSSQNTTIPQGTLVSTNDDYPIWYTTLEPVNIAGEPGAIAVVAVEALGDYIGTAGNTPTNTVNTINGPLNEILMVANIDPIGGGSIPTNRIVAQNDLDRLLSTAVGIIQQRALYDLEPLLGEYQFIVPETIGIVETHPEWTVYSAGVGDVADTVSLSYRATVQATVLDERAINQTAYAGMAVQIPTGLIIQPDSVEYVEQRIEQISEDGTIILMARVASDVVGTVDTDQIAVNITGMNHAEAELQLAQTLLIDQDTPPRITVWPSIFDNRLPLLTRRIQVQVRTP